MQDTTSDKFTNLFGDQAKIDNNIWIGEGAASTSIRAKKNQEGYRSWLLRDKNRGTGQFARA